MLAYHFVGETLRDGSPIPPDGQWLEHKGPLVPCRSGLHASKHPFDALRYAPGNTLCLVELDGKMKEHGQPADKLVARRRKIIKRIDATYLLRRFAADQALSVAHLWDMPDVVRLYLTTLNENYRDAAWDAALAAAQAARAAWDAARAARAARAAWDSARAARAAARDSARAAWDAALAAAQDAVLDAAWDALAAAQDAARDKFKEMVEEAFEICAPNLDGMAREELVEFAKKIDSHPRRNAAVLFPHKQKGYVKTTAQLAHYAWNKATAMRLRESGNIIEAMDFEKICEDIYSTLPEWGRW